MLTAASGCSGSTALDSVEQTAETAPPATPTAAPSTPDQGRAETPPLDAADPEPVPYVPAGRPGTAQAYAELIERLEADVPAALRDEVPWPDLRDPNPIVAQTEIFELWIWMAERHPEPNLVEAMAAPGSPSREDIVSVFGRQQALNQLERRTGAGYQAFDHLVVTFESAGLPLWLGRDVPEDAVVVYYSDNSGPTEITDRDSGQLFEVLPDTPTRTWLSIMVPTEVGWQLWRDQLIEPSDPELEVPDVPPPPGANGERPKPEVW